MTELIDFNAVRAELRAMDRGSLLIIAERALELMPETELHTLLGDFMEFTTPLVDAGTLLKEVRTFSDAAMTGLFYEIVEINNRGRQAQSHGTDAFIAEFHRLLRKCIHAAADQDAPSGVCDSFRLLFGLLRHIDEGNDDVLFFADEGSSSDISVHWRTALPPYFNCLAKKLSSQEFARTVNEAITDFVNHDQLWYWEVANNVANDAQRIALNTIISQSLATAP